MDSPKKDKKMAYFLVGIIIATTAVMVLYTGNVTNYIPVEVTEQQIVIAVIDQGCVVETSRGHTFVVPDCDTPPGNVVTVKFFVPGAEYNGYYDVVREKLEVVDPNQP